MFISPDDKGKYGGEFRKFNKVQKKKIKSLCEVIYQQPLLAFWCIYLQFLHPHTPVR